MKKLFFLAIIALTFTLSSFSETNVIMKPITACTGTKPDGSKVKLIIDNNVRYLVYLDPKGTVTSGPYQTTTVNVDNFDMWCQPLGYRSDCSK